MKSEDEHLKLQNKLKMFVDMMITDRVRDEYPMVESVELTRFTRNNHTDKEYPEFEVKVSTSLTLLTQTNIKQTIREHIESFFPDVFTLLNANIKIVRESKQSELGERVKNVFPKKTPPTTLGMF